MELNNDILESLIKKTAQDLQNKIYEQLNNRILSYLEQFTFDKYVEINKVNDINEKNFLKVKRQNLDILELAINNPGFREPKDPVEAREALKQLNDRYKKIWHDGEREQFKWSNENYINTLNNKIDNYNTRLANYKATMNKFSEGLEKYTLPSLEVPEISYKDLYEEIKQEVVNNAK